LIEPKIGLALKIKSWKKFLKIKNLNITILSKNKLVVLDVGCSLGSLFFVFENVENFVVGIDIERR